MRYGLPDNAIEAIIRVLSKHPSISRAVIYGSRAKGSYRDGSDIDLTLMGDSLTLKEQLRLENELDDLLLPYKIDLSIFHRISDPELIGHIQRVGVTFYNRAQAEVG